MPRDTRKLRRGDSHSLLCEEQCITETVGPALAANDPELVARPFSVEKNEAAYFTNIGYYFGLSAPGNGNNIEIFFVFGDTGYTIGDVVQDDDWLYLSSFWHDYKYYTYEVGGHMMVEGKKFIDLDPDIYLRGSEIDRSKLEIWLQTNASKTGSASITLQYIREIFQQVYPNDNSFSDMDYEEVIEHLENQSQSGQ